MLSFPRDGSRFVWRCSAAALLAVGLSACSSGEAGAPARESSCTVLEPGELATLDAEVHVLASSDALGGAAGSLTRALLPDGGDVYWYDGHGSVFVERQGDGRVVELKRGEPPSETHYEVGLGLAVNAERLFVGFGQRSSSAIDFFPLEYDPPGRLLSISKQDGQSEVLLESADYWMAPIAADAERVVVFALGDHGDGSYDVGFYQVPLAEPRLEPLPLARSISPSESGRPEAVTAFLEGQLVRGQAYWMSDDNRWRLLRAGFDDTEPEVVMEVPDVHSFFVGPGYIMTEENVVLSGYRQVAKDFVVNDDSGCRSVQGPQRGDSVVGTALDVNHAYWSRGNAPGLEPTFGAFELTRIDLETGALLRLNTPGLTPSYYLRIVGQDDTRLFLVSGDTLASLRKP
jgi:hypothetical protein